MGDVNTQEAVIAKLEAAVGRFESALDSRPGMSESDFVLNSLGRMHEQLAAAKKAGKVDPELIDAAKDLLGKVPEETPSEKSLGSGVTVGGDLEAAIEYAEALEPEVGEQIDVEKISAAPKAVGFLAAVTGMLHFSRT